MRRGSQGLNKHRPPGRTVSRGDRQAARGPNNGPRSHRGSGKTQSVKRSAPEFRRAGRPRSETLRGQPLPLNLADW